MDEYKFIKFEKSTMKNKKYDALFRNNKTGKIKKLSFGDRRYAQYKDSTGLGVYSHLNHGDPHRRSLYHQRHAKDAVDGVAIAKILVVINCIQHFIHIYLFYLDDSL
jgi:hypothetical protein